MKETGLEPIAIAYSMDGRLPIAAGHYPAGVSRLFPRALSDNVMVVARRRA